jgi:hypothetical protein
MTLKLKLFGSLHLIARATPITPLLRPRARRLLAYLLLHRHTPLSRQEIAFKLWLDSPEKEALGALRRALSELRTALPKLPASEWIVEAHAGLRWNLDAPYRLDVEAYERLIEQTTPAALHEAISLYMGDLRAQLFEALRQAFLALARSRPLLLLFEDVHWAAESTLDWLIYIASRLSASRLLVVITYRTAEVGAEHALARLGRRFAHEGTVSTISLKPLSREANRAWVAHLSGLEEQVAVRVADRLFVETVGTSRNSAPAQGAGG